MSVRTKSIIVLFAVLAVTVLGLLLGADGRDVAALEASHDPEAGQGARRVREVAELRDATSKTYELAGGQREWVTNGDVVHYQDAAGVWQDVDNRLMVDSAQIDGVGYAYRNTANSYTARFAGDTGGASLLYIECQGSSIAIGPVGARSSRSAVGLAPESAATAVSADAENTLAYPELYPGVDFFYESTGSGIREYVVMKDASAQNQFTFHIKLDGVSAREADGQISFVDDRGETMFWLADAFAVDGSGEITHDVEYELLGTGGNLRLTVTVSRDYLEDPARVFPVVLDPDILVCSPDVMDACVCSGTPATNYGSDSCLRTGWASGTQTRWTLLWFNLAGVDIDPDWIDHCYIRLERAFGDEPVTRAYPCTSWWGSTSVTWNNKPGVAWEHPSTECVSDGGSWWTMDSTYPVKKWLSGAWANCGWTIADTRLSRSYATWFWSANYASSHRPELHICYTPQYCDPTTYLASLRFDGPDWFDSGEQTFPMQGTGRVGIDEYPRLIKTDVDYNGDGYVDVEEAMQMYVPFATGSDIYGTTRDGHYIPAAADVKADQTPAVYWQQQALTGDYSGWTVYQYWLYYPDNDWFNDHEHDWEHYDLYFQDGVLKTTKVSAHSWINQDDWSDWVANGLVEDGTHLKLSPQGGSHAITGAGGGLEDGVELKWTGAVYSHGARLDMVGPSAWRIFSNDPYAVGTIGYSQAASQYDPSYYYYHDAISISYGGEEWGDPRLAPWLRSEYLTPAGPY